MRRLSYLLLTTIFILSSLGIADARNAPLRMKEADGSPNVIPVLDITVENGTLTNDGSGRVTYTAGGFDPTDYGTTTWGAGSGFNWTFDTGTDDPVVLFADNEIIFSTDAGDTSAGQTASFEFITDGAGNGITIENNDDGAASGPRLNFHFKTDSFASNDEIGETGYYLDVSGTPELFYRTLVLANDNGSGTEDTIAIDYIPIAGVQTELIRYNSGGIDINGGSTSTVDFKVQSDGNASMFIVDAGLNAVGIGTAAVANQQLTFAHNGTVGNVVDIWSFRNAVGTGTQTGMDILMSQQQSSGVDAQPLYGMKVSMGGSNLGSNNNEVVGWSIDSRPGITGTWANYHSLESLFIGGASSTITTSKALEINHTTAGTIGTSYGVHIDALGGTTNIAWESDEGSAQWNDDGGDYDFVIEGDTDTDLFHLDASNDSIFITSASGITNYLFALAETKTDQTGVHYGMFLRMNDNRDTASSSSSLQTFEVSQSGTVGSNYTRSSGTAAIPMAVKQATTVNGTGFNTTVLEVTSTQDGSGSVTTTDGIYLDIRPTTTTASNVAGLHVINVNQTTGQGEAILLDEGHVVYTADADTIADSGDGSPATATLTPTAAYVELTCSDTDTCDITMGETDAREGQQVLITNVSANVCDFADTANVSELAGAFAMGQYDTLRLEYLGDRWAEVSRSDN